MPEPDRADDGAPVAEAARSPPPLRPDLFRSGRLADRLTAATAEQTAAILEDETGAAATAESTPAATIVEPPPVPETVQAEPAPPQATNAWIRRVKRRRLRSALGGIWAWLATLTIVSATIAAALLIVSRL